jgi:zinc/manganese transport system permease protein
VMLVIARPLLFATVDEAVAAARGVPVRVLGFGFLALVGACAGEATQAVGSLLLLGLLAAPAGAAIRLTDRPFQGLALSAGLAVAEMWAGLAASALIPSLPPSFAIMAAATAVYGATFLVRPNRRPETAIAA